MTRRAGWSGAIIGTKAPDARRKTVEMTSPGSTGSPPLQGAGRNLVSLAARPQTAGNRRLAPVEDTMKLYMHPVSTATRPVRLLIAENGIPCDEEMVDILAGAHHQQ